MTNEIILTSEQRALLKEYKKEAFTYLSAVSEAKEALKEVVEALAESTGLKKAVVNKLFKDSFDNKVDENLAKAETIKWLSEDDHVADNIEQE